MNSPVHRIKQKISYQSNSVQQSVIQMAQSKNKNKNVMQCCHVAGCHMRLGDGCHCVKVCRTTRTAFFSVGVCIFSVDFVMHVSL